MYLQPVSQNLKPQENQMRIEDMATKLGYTMSTKKVLVSTDNKHYTRRDILLTNNEDRSEIHTFRDRTAVQLFLESKAQVEIPGTKPARGRA